MTVFSTPSETSSTKEKEGSISEKITRKQSFGKAVLVDLPMLRPSEEGGMSKEHSEQGKVKRDVYTQYIQAASTAGFILFLFATVLQQASSVLGNVVLREWGEHNRSEGGNSGTGRYLLGYGMCSLASVALGGVSAVLMLLYVALRSARRLHDQVGCVACRAKLS